MPAPASVGPPGGSVGRVGRVALVVGVTAGGTGAHVRMLAAGLARRGVAVSVLGPPSADAAFGFGALPGVTFSPVEVGDRPRLGDAAVVLRLRRLLGSGPDVVHAHGLRAGALTVLALTGRRRRTTLVVTVHNARPTGRGARVAVYRLLERIVAHGADLVLAVSPDLETRLRSAGARRVGHAIVPPPDPVPPPAPAIAATEIIAASNRPVLLAVGRLAAQKDFATLIEAVARWRDLDPPPLLAIAGEGPLAGELRTRAAALGVDAVFLGHRDDVHGLLKAATVFALPSRWEGQPLILQEALRAGAAIVATRVGGVPDLVGDAAMLVSPGDPEALAAAIGVILHDRALALRLRAAASRRGRRLPTADDAIAAVLAAYAEARARS